MITKSAYGKVGCNSISKKVIRHIFK